MGDKTITAGKYALFTIPGEKEWTIIINADTTLHGASGYDSKKDVHRFKVQSVKAEKFREAFTIDLNEITRSGEGVLSIDPVGMAPMGRTPVADSVDRFTR